MITDWFLSFLQAAVSFGVSPLPASSTGDNFVSNFNIVLNNLGALNYFLPIAETFTAVVAIMFLFPIFMGVTLALWVFAQIRGSSARG